MQIGALAENRLGQADAPERCGSPFARKRIGTGIGKPLAHIVQQEVRIGPDKLKGIGAAGRIAQRDKFRPVAGCTACAVKQFLALQDLRIADILADVAELSAARREAFGLVDDDPGLDGHPDIREEVRVLLGDEVEWLFKS